ncbi:MAG TPA: DUF1415 domain-containing protein [Caldimonas sp.]|jgi:hypothetical protein|nr:DUF1415 domain-containing protein [Caldimonas sp.]HEX2540006.1 DUF1415 domain-containing protein [Caldimonas sp.]
MDPPRLDPGLERRAIAETRAWLEHVVIGLNLCPFAKAVVAKGQVRCAVTAASDEAALVISLREELALLAAADPAEIDTTLLICPSALPDFDDYNDFLDEADALLREMDLEGVIQVASFHPDYRFADSDPDDVTHATSRSPWPMLHLLREDSVERALAAVPDPDAIVEANVRTLRALGNEGWAALRRRYLADAEEAG